MALDGRKKPAKKAAATASSEATTTTEFLGTYISNITPIVANRSGKWVSSPPGKWAATMKWEWNTTAVSTLISEETESSVTTLETTTQISSSSSTSTSTVSNATASTSSTSMTTTEGTKETTSTTVSSAELEMEGYYPGWINATANYTYKGPVNVDYAYSYGEEEEGDYTGDIVDGAPRRKMATHTATETRNKGKRSKRGIKLWASGYGPESVVR